MNNQLTNSTRTREYPESYYAVMSVAVAQQDRDEKLWPGPVSELLCPFSQTSVQLLTVDHLL